MRVLVSAKHSHDVAAARVAPLRMQESALLLILPRVLHFRVTSTEDFSYRRLASLHNKNGRRMIEMAIRLAHSAVIVLDHEEMGTGVLVERFLDPSLKATNAKTMKPSTPLKKPGKGQCF